MLKAKWAAVSNLFPNKGGMLGMWYHPVGVHWVDKKQIVCREIAEAGPCSVCERIREMESQGLPESDIVKIRGPLKFAMSKIRRKSYESNPPGLGLERRSTSQEPARVVG
jgi:hypothetical protein